MNSAQPFISIATRYLPLVLTLLNACSSPSQPENDDINVLLSRYSENEYVVLSDSQYSYDELAQEITQYYQCPILHIDSLSTRVLSPLLRHIAPSYALIVIPPDIILEDLVVPLFDAFCSIEGAVNDVYLDVAYGYITGYTVEDARDLFYRTKSDTTTLEHFLGVSHVFENDEWCHSAIAGYAARFSEAGWDTNTVIVNDSRWMDNYHNELGKFTQKQLIYIIGHGSYTSLCSISNNHLDNVDLTGNIILSGACKTGGISPQSPESSIALKILSLGPDIYISSISGNGWINMEYIGDNIGYYHQTIGQSLIDGLNGLIFRSIEDVLPDYIASYAKYVILYGDPSYIPVLSNYLP